MISKEYIPNQRFIVQIIIDGNSKKPIYSNRFRFRSSAFKAIIDDWRNLKGIKTTVYDTKKECVCE